MNTKDKQLLLRDLCARLPYGVKCQFEDAVRVRDGKSDPFYDNVLSERDLDLYVNHTNFHIKPYLRPMSSMTEEEKKKLKADTCPEGTGYFDEKYLICPVNHYGEYISYEFMSAILEWLNANHFDYRGLIEKGLALEAPEGMYDTKATNK